LQAGKETRLKIHEYQAKQLLANHGIPTPRGKVASTVEEALSAATELGDGPWVVKAQIHAGGRGKAGGVKLAKSPAEAQQAASEILGMTLHTPQTGPEGKCVRKVYVEAGSSIADELYLAILFDRAVERFERKKDAKEARNLIDVNLTKQLDGPFGLAIFGDPHLDDDGCNWPKLLSHRRLNNERHLP
jgi:biotin carboxylase